MTISYVGGITAGRANGNSNLSVAIDSGLSGGSGGAPIEGDLVVVTVSVGTAARTPALAITTPSGYDTLTAQRTSATTYDTNVQTSYKFMGATPDTTVTIPACGNNADGQAYTIQVFRGVDTTTPMDTAATYATGSGTNNRPDPAAITPVTDGAWIVVCTGGSAGTGTTALTASYLTNLLFSNGADTNDGNVASGYFDGWTSGEYNPAVFAGGSVNAANSWGATTIALRPAPPAAQDITGTAYSLADTFGAGVVAAGAVAIVGALFAGTPSFGAGDVTQGGAGQSISAVAYTDGDTFGAGTVTRGTVTLTGTAYSQADTFGAGTVTTGPVTVTGTAYSQADTFGAGSVTRGAVAVTGTAYAQADTFGAGVLSVGPVAVTGAAYSAANAFGAGTVAPGAVTLTGALYGDTDAFGAGLVSVDGGPQAITGTAYAEAETFWLGALSVGPVSVTGTGLADGDTFGAGAVSVGAVGIDGATYVNANAFGAGIVLVEGGTQAITGTAYAEADIFGAGSFAVGQVSIAGTVYADGDTFGAATVAEVTPTDPERTVTVSADLRQVATPSVARVVATSASSRTVIA